MKTTLRLLTALTILSLGAFAYAGDKDKKSDAACTCGEACKCTKDGKACACKAEKKEDKKDEKKPH
jgi:hypothetical protein